MPNVIKDLLRPLSPFLNDPSVTDIVVNRPCEIGIKSGGDWDWEDVPSFDPDRQESIGLLTAYNTGQDISDARPMCMTSLPTKERNQICRFPVTEKGIVSMSIRRPPGFRPTLEALQESGTFEVIDAKRRVDQRILPVSEVVQDDEETYNVVHPKDYETAKDLLKRGVAEKKNIIISGETGSGKTTLMRALIDAIPLNQRIITIEDARELLDIPHRNWVSLLYSKGDQSAASIDCEDLLQASLRMIPTRILLGELRDGAAYSYQRVMVQHPGCLTTLHSISAIDAFRAMRLMVRGSVVGRSMNDADNSAMLYDDIDIVAHMENLKVVDIYEKTTHRASLGRPSDRPRDIHAGGSAGI